jgi:hypothetical protein
VPSDTVSDKIWRTIGVWIKYDTAPGMPCAATRPIAVVPRSPDPANAPPAAPIPPSKKLDPEVFERLTVDAERLNARATVSASSILGMPRMVGGSWPVPARSFSRPDTSLAGLNVSPPSCDSCTPPTCCRTFGGTNASS